MLRLCPTGTLLLVHPLHSKFADHPTLADRRGAVRESLERMYGPRRFETEWRTRFGSSGSSQAQRLPTVRLKVSAFIPLSPSR